MLPGPEHADQCWPPEFCEPINRQIEVWAAWHSGSPEALAAIYSGQENTDTTGFFASEAGGVKATLKRWVSHVVRYFWGQRSPGNQPRRRLHVPIAGDIASASADLLFSEPPVFTVENETAQEILDQVMADGLHATLLEGGETCAALSGVYLRLRWDTEVRELPWIDVIGPDCAVPEWEMGQLSAVTFWRVLRRKGRTVVRHLERHEVGAITHAVYEGTEDTLGHVASLADYPETLALAETLTDGDEITVPSDRPTAVYVPNMRPNRIWRNLPQAVFLGASDYSGIEGLMDALDLTYSSLIRDVDLGKARLIVPRQYMTSHGRGEGASVDLDRELYEPIDAMGEGEGLEIKEIQFKIRYEEHEQVINRLKTDIVTSAGYSAQTFGINGEAAVTATEVAARERRSHITRDRKTQYWGPALTTILGTLLDIAGHKGLEVSIEWPAAVSVDPEAEARTLRELEAARAISTEQKVKRLHPDWEKEDVEEEVALILKEQQIGQAEDPGTFTGGTFDPGGINETMRQSADLLANAKRAQSPLRGAEGLEGEA